MSAEVLLGLDVGTTNVKAAAYTPDGRALALAAEPLPVTQPRPGWSEFVPETLYRTAAATIRTVMARLDGTHVAGIAVASMAETAVPLAADGAPLHNAVAWYDERAVPMARWWRREVGSEAVYRITGLPILPIFGINKLLWFRDHDPAAFARMHAWLNVADYVVFRLCGEQATDLSLASRMMTLDLERRRWSEDLLAACDVHPSLLAPLVESGQPVGAVHRTGSEETGLPVGTPVVAGGHDHPCGALALGLREPGDVLDSMGTAEALLTVVERPRLSAAMAAGGYQQGAHVVPGRTYCLGGLYTSGAAIAWLRSILREDVDDTGDPYAAMLAWAAAAPLGSGGVYFLPHLRLAGPPIDDLDSRAAFVGMTAATTRGDLARAVIEGLAYEAQASLDGLVERMDLRVRRVRAIGGGTRNQLLLRVKAALSGAPIEVAAHDEAASLGAAMLAGVGAGLYPSVAEAPDRVAIDYRTVDVEEPWRGPYRRAFDSVYRQLYRDLADLHHAIGDLVRSDATPPTGASAGMADRSSP